ncbi:hypothetical protein ACET3Z_009873 [Daucus carota]
MAAVLHALSTVGRQCSLFETDIIDAPRFSSYLHKPGRAQMAGLQFIATRRHEKCQSCYTSNRESIQPVSAASESQATVIPAASAEVASAQSVSAPAWSINDLAAQLKFKNYKQDEVYEQMATKLEIEIRMTIEDEMASNPLNFFELIDNIERLGLGYRFEKDISTALTKYVSLEGAPEYHNSLHSTALRFRLLREHGYKVSQDVFQSFKDENGAFMPSLLADVKGLLSLYEASFLAFQGETFLDEARSFARKGLEYVMQKTESKLLAKLIGHTLALPWYRRTLRFAARPYIDVYSRMEDSNELLLQLAKLDFNIVQSALQQDLVQVMRWWQNIGLSGKLSFSTKDSLLQCFFWTIGISFEPHLSDSRISLTKLATFLTVIDDLYDDHGSVDELELFTDSVRRWNVDAVDDLPDSLRLFFLALYNTVNEMAYDALKEHGENPLPLFKKVWGDLCQALLQETKWNHEKSIPELDDYVENGWRSSSGVVILAHAFPLRSQNITKEALDILAKDHHLLKWSSMVFRLCNDLASFTRESKSGETANSVTSYMYHNGVSEDVAREHIKNLIDDAWKQMNEARVSLEPQFSTSFTEAAINLARLSHSAYGSGDDHRIPDKKAKKQIFSLLMEPFPVTLG